MRSSRASSVDFNEDEIGPEPALDPYNERNGVRIGKPCPLSKDVYTLFFLANIEHWYDVPLEHSDGDMDYLLSNILTLVVSHIVLITAVLKYVRKRPDCIPAEDANFLVLCRFIGSLIL